MRDSGKCSCWMQNRENRTGLTLGGMLYQSYPKGIFHKSEVKYG